MFTVRVPVSLAAGAVLSAALFLGLWQLVSVPFATETLLKTTIVEFTRQRVDTPAESKRVPKPVREQRIVDPGPPSLAHGESGDVVLEYRPPAVEPVIDHGGLATSGIDGDVTPIVRMDPDYPPRAAASNTEGWVQVRFAVTTAGTVRDAVVIASEPGTIFDDAALQAVARWRYNPRVVDGVAVERVGLETVFRFELE